MPKLIIIVETIDGSTVYKESMSVNVDKDNTLTRQALNICSETLKLADRVLRELDPSII